MATNFYIAYPDIPLASTTTGGKTEDSSYPLKNVITGSRGNFHRINTATSDDYYMLFDCGSGVTKSAQYLAIERANLLDSQDVTKVKLTGSSSSCFAPTSVTGCKLWLDATRGITKDGSNKVSQWDDLSGTGNHATQGTGANQPTWITPASGINGNATITFAAASSIYMTANNAASVFTGNDTPHTAFAVFKKSTTGTSTVYLAGGNSGSSTIKHQYYTGSSPPENYLVSRRDGVSSTLAAGGTPDSSSAHVISNVFSGTTISAWADGVNIINASSMNVNSITIDRVGIGAHVHSTPATFFDGQICELILYDSALGTTDRQTIEEYLAAKWTRTPQLSSTAFNSATYYGPRTEDYITNFSASTAYRYWWLQMGIASGTTKYPFSKSYFGTLFDFGRDPVYSLLQKRIFTGASNREPRYVFEVEWQGITDTIRNSFVDKIVKYKDINPVILYDTGDLVLNDMRQIHAWLKDVEIDPNTYNNNTIRCRFEEAL